MNTDEWIAELERRLADTTTENWELHKTCDTLSSDCANLHIKCNQKALQILVLKQALIEKQRRVGAFFWPKSVEHALSELREDKDMQEVGICWEIDGYY